MPTASLYFFSGTGNTERLMRRLRQGLEACGYQVAVRSAEAGRPEVREADLCIFAFPVYAFAAPALMLRHLRSAPPGEGRPAAVLATIGEINARRTVPGWEGQALVHVARLLRRRGYRIFLTATLCSPHSMTNAVNPPPPAEQADIMALADAQVEGVVARLVAGEPSFQSCSPAHQVWSGLVAQVFLHLGRRGFGKLYVADARCTSCGLCARSCPVGTIRLRRGRPRWGWRCEACERCINRCPPAAIQTSLPRLLVSLALLFLPYGRLLAGSFPRAWAAVESAWWGLPLEWLAKLALLAVAALLLDLLLLAAEHTPGLRWVALWNFTHRFRRYLAPGFQPPERL